MKKKLFTLLLALVAIATTAQAQVVLNETNFPDANFRKALAEILQVSEGDEITAEKIAATTSLAVSRYGKPDNEKIADLTGIEHFTALTRLDCNGNQLTSLDVSKNTALTYLGCYNNQLTSLDVSKNTALYQLSCNRNQLTSLDVSKNTYLQYLTCYSNQLTSLDVSKNTALKSLECYGNQLTSLNVSGCTALTLLWCWCNNIKGEAMDALVTSLPTVERGQFVVISTEDKSEGNFCTKSQVAVAKGKGWEVYDIYNWNIVEYEGIENVTLNAENFPDANFRAALAEKFGISEGDEISAEMIAATTFLKVNGHNKAESEKIADLTGIEHFTALSSLVCYYNRLTSLDVSKNTKLGYLECLENQLTSLDVSKNTKLTTLYCDGNQLTSLDVSKNTYLQYLTCNGNQLTSLDVSKNTMLCYLQCEGNLLTSLDVSKNAPLWGLYCSRNQLTSLDVSKNTKLRNLHCDGNQLTSLNVSNNTALAELFCYDNQLTSLDVSKNTKLTYLFCDGNQLTSLDVSKNTKLTDLRCYGNQIKGEAMNALVASLPTVNNGSFFVINTKDEKEGNVCTKAQVAVAKGKGWTVYDHNGSSGNWQEYEGSDDAAAKLLLNAENFPDANFRAALAEKFGISEGDEITAEKIAATTSLDVSKSYKTPDEAKIADLTGIEHFTALTKLYCDYNNLTTLDVSKNVKLEYLSCRMIPLASLDLSKNTELLELLLWSNQLTELDLSNNTKLEKLEFGNFANVDFPKNEVSSLNLSKNTALRTMNFQMLGLTSLDVSKNTALTKLYCYNNQLTSLDVSQNTALTNLRCDGNQLTSLDVTKNTALTSLNCYDNQLTTLDVSKNTALTELWCNNNQLTSLDVSKNTALEYLYCEYNQLTSLDVSKNTALENLQCHGNQLTALDVSKNTALTVLPCFSNQIKGEAMDALVASLPTVENGKFYVIDTKDENEGNVCTKAQVAVAKGKGWKVYDYNGGYVQEYEGSDPVEEDIDPVDEDDNIDFGNDMDENSDLDGNVIGNIYYNVGNGNGEYDAENGCVVITKPTDDGTMNDLEGKDIFGEDFKGQFTGIAFKVPTGKGTVKVTAETTGNMLLKVKIGNNDPVDMELEGKLKISFPYNVTETTLVAIYAGTNNEAKGFGTTNDAEDAALKIYGIEFERDDTTAIDASLNDNGQRTNDSWYTIDGKKLNGEPTKKGVYIHKGKKVKK